MLHIGVYKKIKCHDEGEGVNFFISQTVERKTLWTFDDKSGVGDGGCLFVCYS